MTARVRFYFDFISPYAYLAWSDAKALAARTDTEVSFEPILFAGLLNHWGQLGPAEIGPKKRFTFRDAYRRAHDRGLSLTPPATHPFNPLTALRLAQPEVAGDLQTAIVDTLYHHAWGEGGELGDPKAIAEALTRAGLDATLVERTQDPAVKERLKARTADAVERGVFGVPTFLAERDGETELFWGHDRFRDLERWIAGEDPAANIAADLERSASADRRS
ncbi:MAG: 2-hydroxychromene-2-carboxylate isomerase [Deltaproteobacteria bacterium]|nr:2-hydroxychromene-2-carboxylate isomerase [Deltaproteobacteria bacterium]